ncbi:transcriptional regulator [Candidatus Bathyarchaeota archaeon]|nr:transcriptional regulator [Candidatus Bathyarchaeota archaeon]
MNNSENKFPTTYVTEINKVIHEPTRLGIVAHLYVLDSADALFLKNQMNLTWGNLSSHLSKLEDAGYIEVIKEFIDRKPVTSLRLTEKGRDAFRNYRIQLKSLLDGLPP